MAEKDTDAAGGIGLSPEEAEQRRGQEQERPSAAVAAPIGKQQGGRVPVPERAQTLSLETLAADLAYGGQRLAHLEEQMPRINQGFNVLAGRIDALRGSIEEHNLRKAALDLAVRELGQSPEEIVKRADCYLFFLRGPQPISPPADMVEPLPPPGAPQEADESAAPPTQH